MDKYIYLDGQQFEVDTQNGQLHRGDLVGEAITIPEMNDQGLYYVLLLNRADKTIFKGTQREAEQDDKVSIVRIPKKIFQEGTWNDDEKIRIINHMSQTGKWNIMLVDQVHYNRLHGDPPLVDIAGVSFSVDVLHGRLSKIYDFDKVIDLSGIPENDQGRYECYYDTKKLEVYRPPAGLTELPEGVVGLVIPSRVEMDPFGEAWRHSTDVISFLLEHPLHAKTFATVVPLAKTRMPEIIERNRERLKGQQKKQQQKITRPRKRGKGI